MLTAAAAYSNRFVAVAAGKSPRRWSASAVAAATVACP